MDKTEINIFLVLSFLIVITMMMGLFYFVFQFRKRKIHEELEKLKSIHLERERIIKDLHDELGGSLNSIQLISALILNNHLSQNKILECVSKIDDTSKNVSQQIKMVIWSLDSEKDTLLNLIEFCKQYVIQFLEPTKIKLITHNNYHNENVYISGYFRKNVFLVVKEIINNCVKHSQATEIKFCITTIENDLKISIQDNGIGITNYNSFGNGLKNIKRRIESINGNLSIENNKGTLIYFNVPLTFVD